MLGLEFLTCDAGHKDEIALAFLNHPLFSSLMKNKRLMQVFATVSAEPRYFLARYVLNESEGLTTTEIKREIREGYPHIYEAFFQRSKNYAQKLCEKGISKIGLAEEIIKTIDHPFHGEIDAKAFIATSLVNGIEAFVNFWWRKELGQEVHASGYLSHNHNEKRESIYYRALTLYTLLHMDEGASVGDLGEEIWPIYQTATKTTLVGGEEVEYSGQRFKPIHRHVTALAGLEAVAVEECTSKKTKFRDAKVHLTEKGHGVVSEFIGPMFDQFDALWNKNVKRKTFNSSDLFELLRMHYSSK